MNQKASTFSNLLDALLMPDAAFILGLGQTGNPRSINYPYPLFSLSGLAHLSTVIRAKPIRKVLRKSESGWPQASTWAVLRAFCLQNLRILRDFCQTISQSVCSRIR